MTISQLIEMCERRIAYLNGVRGSAAAIGDIQQLEQIDAQLAETQQTLNHLQTLLA
jgi:hypothetical protein